MNELVLEVGDLEQAEHFYSELLGFPVVERWEQREAIWVLAGSTRIGLWRPQVGVAGGRGGVHVHYALQIEEKDYAAIVEGMRGRGLDVTEDDFGHSRAVYVTDPDAYLSRRCAVAHESKRSRAVSREVGLARASTRHGSRGSLPSARGF